MFLHMMGESIIMNVALIDDDKLCLAVETEVLKNVSLIDKVESFSSPDDLIDYANKEKIDVAFLDIILGEVDGIILASEIKQIQPACKIVFVSASRDYTLEAFQVFASGYILKPLDQLEVERILSNI